MTGSGLALTIVGPAPAWTRRPGRASSCYLLELGGEAIALDFGTGAFAALSQLRDPQTLRAVVISHLHADHLIDIVPLRYYLRFGCDPPGHVEIRAPADLAKRIDGLTAEPGFLGELVGAPHEPGTFELGPFTVQAGRITHTESSFGFRVTATGSAGAPGIVYSGDCGDPRDLRALIQPGDVVLSEAFFGSRARQAGLAHLTAADAAWAAADGGARELVLTHIQDDVDHQVTLAAAAAVFPAVRLAEPGMRVAID